MTKSHNRGWMTTTAILQTAQRELHAKPNSASDGREMENDNFNEEQATTTTTTTTTTIPRIREELTNTATAMSHIYFLILTRFASTHSSSGRGTRQILPSQSLRIKTFNIPLLRGWHPH